MEQRGRLWLVAGIVLVIVAVLSNAPGLDTTLLLSVDEDGQAPWGSARTVDPLASDPDSSTSLTQAVWLDPLGLGVLGVRLVGVACLAVLAWAMGTLLVGATQRRRGRRGWPPSSCCIRACFSRSGVATASRLGPCSVA